MAREGTENDPDWGTHPVPQFVTSVFSNDLHLARESSTHARGWLYVGVVVVHRHVALAHAAAHVYVDFLAQDQAR
jgi:hypothetical protein